MDVFARVLAEIGRADDKDLEALRPGLVASPRTGRGAHCVLFLELDDLVVDLRSDRYVGSSESCSSKICAKSVRFPKWSASISAKMRGVITQAKRCVEGGHRSARDHC